MAKFIKKEVYYFEEPGDQNTEQVLEAVSKRVAEGKINKVVVASTSGKTALKFARSLQGKAEIFRVSESPFRREWKETWPCLNEENHKALKELGAIVINNIPYVFHNSVVDAARWDVTTPERLVKETLYCFGQGLKVAVEIALTAVSCGFIPPFEDVIAVGGSGNGADTAIVLRGTYPACIFDKDPQKRLEIREIIAMPLAKKWWD